MPPKLNRFNVGLYNKIKKKEKDAALRENAKLMNCVAEENRKLKSTQMKLKRLQEKLKRLRAKLQKAEKALGLILQTRIVKNFWQG